MSIYLLQLVGKWIGLLVVSLASVCGSIDLKEERFDVENKNKDKNISVINTVVNYKTITKYTNRLPYNDIKVIIEGEDGIIYEDEQGNITKIVREVVDEVVEKGTGPSGHYVGRMTGYGPDCYGCSKVGNVACRTDNGSKHSLINDGIYYDDNEYGEVRILAAETNVFPCGTIIEVDNGRLKPFIGVVLDSGYAMRSAWKEKQQVLIDLAFATEKDPTVSKATSNYTKYDVKRWGW